MDLVIAVMKRRTESLIMFAGSSRETWGRRRKGLDSFGLEER